MTKNKVVNLGAIFTLTTCCFGQVVLAEESCYDLGKRYGRCSYSAMLGKSCDPEDDIVIPKRCRDQSDTKAGIKAGMKEVASGNR